MNLSLIAINSRFTHSCPALYYLKAAVRHLPVHVTLQEFTIHQQAVEMLAKIKHAQPDVVACSIYIWSAAIFRELIPAIQAVLPDTRMILGGPEVSGNPGYWRTLAGDDAFIVTGFGERPFRELVESLSSDEANPANMSKNLFDPEPDFASLPFLYSENDIQELKGKYIYYEASRGCPFQCAYCVSSHHNLQKRGLEKVLPELARFAEYQPSIVKLVDRSFNADPDYAYAIWEYLIELNPQTRFHFEVYPALLREKDIRLLATAPDHLFQFEIGIQSTHDEILRGVKRYESWEKVHPLLERLIAPGNIHIHLDMLCGLPFQTTTHIRTSFNRIFQLRADHFQMGFLKVLPGTNVFEDESDFACFREAPYHILKTRWLSFDEISQLLRIARLLDLFWNSENFQTTVGELVSRASSPFDFFVELLDWWDRQNISLQSATWQVMGKYLAAYIDDDPYLIDCLRWDWCKIANSHWFPEYLRARELDKRAIIEKLHRFYKEIPLQQLKKAVIFEPETEDFRLRVMDGRRYACFIPGSTGKITRFLDDE